MTQTDRKNEKERERGLVEHGHDESASVKLRLIGLRMWWWRQFFRAMSAREMSAAFYLLFRCTCAVALG